MSEKSQAWNFTYFGGTVSKQGSKRSQANFVSERVFPLSTTQVGDRVVIQQIQSGDNMLNSLRKIGLTLGSEVQVISKTKSGSIIMCIKDKQIGLGTGMANQVMVTFAAERS